MKNKAYVVFFKSTRYRMTFSALKYAPNVQDARNQLQADYDKNEIGHLIKIQSKYRVATEQDLERFEKYSKEPVFSGVEHVSMLMRGDLSLAKEN